MDILHSNRLFSVNEYLTRLYCRELQISLDMSTSIYASNGYLVTPSLEFFNNYIKENEICT